MKYQKLLMLMIAASFGVAHFAYAQNEAKTVEVIEDAARAAKSAMKAEEAERVATDSKVFEAVAAQRTALASVDKNINDLNGSISKIYNVEQDRYYPSVEDSMSKNRNVLAARENATQILKTKIPQIQAQIVYNVDHGLLTSEQGTQMMHKLDAVLTKPYPFSIPAAYSSPMSGVLLPEDLIHELSYHTYERLLVGNVKGQQHLSDIQKQLDDVKAQLATLQRHVVSGRPESVSGNLAPTRAPAVAEGVAQHRLALPSTARADQ